MKARYTATAASEFESAILHLLTHAPAVAADFADNIERAIDGLLANPYSAQETELREVRRRYVARFRYSIFYSVDETADELIYRNIRHAARRWPWINASDSE